MLKYQKYIFSYLGFELCHLSLFRVLSLIWHLSFVICYCYLPCPSQLTLIGGIVKCHQTGSVIPELKNAYSSKV